MPCYEVQLGQHCKKGEISVSTGSEVNERACCPGETPMNKMLPGVSQIFPIGSGDTCQKPKGDKCPPGTTFAISVKGDGKVSACCGNLLAVNTPDTQN